MIAIGRLFVRTLCDCFKSRPRLETEILAPRHQLNVLQQRILPGAGDPDANADGLLVTIH
jgi:hypothetical protein